MRKLATIRRIAEIKPIDGADKIELAIVDGWQVVVKKDEFKIDLLCLYIEIDSWVPHELVPFLSKGKEPRVFNGVKGERLRTIKLRKQLSQGLLLPVKPFDHYSCMLNFVVEHEGNDGLPLVSLGDDVTELLNIQKWEAPLPACLQGQAIGRFPTFIQKTDQDRIQNLKHEIMYEYYNEEFEVSIKIDGSSLTAYRNEEEYGVCSRNINLKDTEGNSFWVMAHKKNMLRGLEEVGRNIALQGELFGSGIQGNPEQIEGHDFALFDIYDINLQRKMYPNERMEIVKQLDRAGCDIDVAPVIGIFKPSDFGSIEKMLEFAEGKCYYGKNNEREGLVWKHLTSTFSFKTISNKFLLVGGD